MQSICSKISFYFKNQLDMHEDDREIIEYALFVVLGAGVEFLIIFLIAYILGMLKYTLFLSVSFMFFRIFSGGAHCDTYKNCFVVSLVIIIFFSLIVKAFASCINKNIFNYIYFFINIYSVYCVVRYVPKDTPNRPINNKYEKLKFKKYTMLALVLYNIIICSLLYFKIPYTLVLSGIMGLFLQMLSTTHSGNTFIKKIDKVIS